jgi:Divergent InlB B-repeat domain
MILGSVTSTPAGIDCGLLCTSTTAAFPSGTVVTLTAQAAPGGFQAWTGDCAGDGTCVVTMSSNKDVVAHFTLLGSAGGRPDTGVQPSALLRSSLGLARARGEVTLDGRAALTVTEGEAQVRVQVRAGDNLVEGWLKEATGRGLWRFELAGAGPGESHALRVLAGEVASMTPNAVTFRMRGEPGERVSFVLRIAASSQAAPPPR